jgi:hypothetical protein
VIRSADRATPTEPRTSTPKHLAEKILTYRSAIEGERKQVTVLVADVKGSMDHRIHDLVPVFGIDLFGRTIPFTGTAAPTGGAG